MMFTALKRFLNSLMKAPVNTVAAVATVVRGSLNIIAASLMGLLISGAAWGQSANTSNSAQSKWWFDIELIVFKHAIDGSQLVEQFDNAIVPIDLSNSRDLLLEQLFPNTQRLQRSLVQCYVSENDTITLPQQTAPGFKINESLFEPVVPDPLPEFSGESAYNGDFLNAFSSTTSGSANFSASNRATHPIEQSPKVSSSFFNPLMNQAPAQETVEHSTTTSKATARNNELPAQTGTAQTRPSIGDSRDSDQNDAQRAEDLESQQLQNIQMAFSMPPTSDNPVELAESREPTNEELAPGSESTIEAVTNDNELNPQASDSFTESDTSLAINNTSSPNENNTTPINNAEPAPTQLYEPMALNTPWYSRYQSMQPGSANATPFIQVDVPENLGCRFSEEFGDRHGANFNDWLSTQIKETHDIESEVALLVEQDQLQHVIGALSQGAQNQADSPSDINLMTEDSATTDPFALEPVQPSVNYPDTLPLRYNALNRYDTHRAYLLPQSAHRLKKMARDIHRRRGIRNILHIAWRQHVQFGRDKADSYRIIAGKNYSGEFAYNGFPLVEGVQISPQSVLSEYENQPLDTQNREFIHPDPAQNLLQNINAALNALDNTALTGPSNSSAATTSNTPVLLVPDVPAPLTPEQVWELDGLFKVYLQYIGRVPYLHIDSQFNFRQPMIMEEQQFPEPLQTMLNETTSGGTEGQSPQYFLKPYHFQQLRRVVSRQIHYFDHPMFGMVVQIRRYQIPDFIR